VKRVAATRVARPGRAPARRGRTATASGADSAGGSAGGAAARAVAALDFGMLPDLLGYRLRLAQLAVFRDFERSVGVLGVSPGRVGVLVLVEANPGLAQSRLAEAVGLDRSTLVPLLDRFEREGLLERRAGPDRRTNGLHLTAEGRRHLARVKRAVREHEGRMLTVLSEAERATLIGLLGRLTEANGTPD
jgi:DNA-binding MarR family transcriptional regulator